MNTSTINRTSIWKLKRALAVGLAGALVLGSGMQAQARTYNDTFPEQIDLPNGFQPEGIAAGRGTTLYIGSIPTGAIYRADARTGKGSVLVPAQEGRGALGMSFDPRTNNLFVAGGFNGHAYVYDARTGAAVADYQLTTITRTLVNDVAITRDAVYFTDTFRPVLYRLPLNKDGSLPKDRPFQEVALSGDFEYLPELFNFNGIVATPDGKTLIAVHSDLGRLYRIDPASGKTTQIDLGVPRVGQDASDGLVLNGRMIYIINGYNQIIPIQLSPDRSSGKIQESITNPAFDFTSTAARIGSTLYAVNARFGTTPTLDTPYWVTRVALKN